MVLFSLLLFILIEIIYDSIFNLPLQAVDASFVVFYLIIFCDVVRAANQKCNLLIILIFGIGSFNIGHPLLRALSLSYLDDYYIIDQIHISDQSRKISLFAHMWSILIISFGYFFVMKKIKTLKPAEYNVNWHQIGKIIVMTFFPLYLIKLIIELRYINSNNYIDMYVGGLNSVDYFSPFINYSHLFFIAGFSGLLASNMQSKDLIIWIFLYIILAFVDSLKGSRGALIIPLVYVLWLVCIKNNIALFSKRNLIKLFMLLSIVVIFADFMVVVRGGESELNPFINALVLNGKTNDILAVTQEVALPKTEYGYVTEPLLFPLNYFKYYDILKYGQSDLTVNIRENLNHRLTYYLNKNYYLAGGGLGSSYVAEIFEFGIIECTSMSLLVGFLIGIYEKFKFTRICLFFSPLIVGHLFIMPRAELFPNGLDLIKTLVIYLILACITNVMGKRSKINII